MTLKLKPQILILGMAGGLAQMLAKIIQKERPDIHIVGMDPRAFKVKGVECIRMRYTRNNLEKVFRSFQFECVYHLGRRSHVSSNPASAIAQRLKQNVVGTKALLDLCVSHQVKRVVVLSTFHVYGAYPDNSVFLTEKASLRASLKHPDLRDVVEMDQLVASWMFENQNEIKTILLRPTNIIGPRINNAITKYLKSYFAPIPIDYNPMFQFINEFDMARVLLACLDRLPTGTYNVAPKDFISLEEAKKLLKVSAFPLPIVLADPLSKVLKLLGKSFPGYLIDYLKYSCLIDGSKILSELEEDFFKFSIERSLKMLT